MGFIRIYDGIPSGYLTIAMESGPFTDVFWWFTYEKYGDSPVRYVK